MALFSPVKIGHHSLKHRIVLAPLTRFRASSEGVPTPDMATYYGQRATNGGLLITEATFISQLSGGFPNAPGIYTAAQIEGWKQVTKEVHSKGGVIFLQLWHLGRASSSSMLPNNERPVSASELAIPGKNRFGEPNEVPRALTLPEIHATTQDYVKAAKNALEAGFDGVEVHSANGYLLDQFINSSSNKRTDIYGGSIENRTRFTLEVVKAVSEAIGADRTGLRLSPWSEFQGMEDETPYETWGYIVKELQTRLSGLSYLHIVEPRVKFFTDDRSTATETLDPFRSVWKGAFISAGGYTLDPEKATSHSEATGDLVAFGRAFIANPDLVERIRHQWKLTPYDRSTFYTPGNKGYTDYKIYENRQASL
ncbi:hypothetical protein J3Q64DRAFT_1748762 [Phycomyces blakesleeanus]|uniref:NADH:flavin oxidoreductase/NADH oxidase N-terminal domain-containing protein n=2 Tax=Phycomyces blakesleeanus TaxID=4837 RepID=A0A162NFT6_PHYB8|nr:hypothetical protein PHYBLDRAFT_181382 [Phycomyces blakesleeanus NRRL 1555(-)]OAD73838.1 hypothetical protein PHYBLDRAFT_181382 [Phycomyces blakesleeanus NRRL 1555(-)]|eukprot:XP_018291878.1 hypothetical protein PHYBLDRAFT_181382 [Phycomyces blakesleeanus NRRL 1555(-)]